MASINPLHAIVERMAKSDVAKKLLAARKAQLDRQARTVKGPPRKRKPKENN